MPERSLLEHARRAAGLNQAELAGRAGTSRTAISAYENGRKSPSLTTLTRLLDACGFEIEAVPQVSFHDVPGQAGRQYRVPDRLPRLPVEDAFAVVVLPVALNWSQPGREFRLASRADRASLYEIVLQEGSDQDIQTYVDGALLVDLWDDLGLPRDLRCAWEPLISAAVGCRGA
ncbi:MAG: helix-turn-helix transcriptional regulator [Ornithinimicrobium sp.]|uniref:helix-turn-helix transcriptional regulator n=1 Tax=Ornithinimicrobium sp. TaxID=1977084 RepID=UPI003D9AFF12